MDEQEKSGGNIEPVVLPEPHGELPNPEDNKRLPSQTQNRAAKRGGFMNGGAMTTVLFLIAFFISSFGFGVYYERSLARDEAIDAITKKLDTLASVPGLGDRGNVLGLQDGAKVKEKIPIDEKRARGNPNAKVTIIEYSDYECPFCKSFYDNAYKEIVKKYVDSGQVRIAFKDYPLAFHPNAQSAAEASRCAAEQGKFWEMHDRMFENQKALSVDNYKKWAGELGLDTAKFNTCVDNKAYATAVVEDMEEAAKIGVQGTPMFIINGEVLVGAQPMAAFENVIKKYL
jgi:protein-disulfide isomerase